MLCRLSVKLFVIYIFFGFCLWQVQSRYSYAAGQPTVQHSTKFQYNQQQADADSLAKQVTIKRTKHGVPHIEAENMRAAGFALGYVQMEDYGGKVTNGLIRARGEWAKYHEVDTDKLNDVLDSDAANRRKYARAVETWQYLEKEKNR
jgi:acyl-homoserine lactone acylase PvdQ